MEQLAVRGPGPGSSEGPWRTQQCGVMEQRELRGPGAHRRDGTCSRYLFGGVQTLPDLDHPLGNWHW